MNVKWEDVREDYALKDSEIKSLRGENENLKAKLNSIKVETVDYIHDALIDHCSTLEEARNEIAMYSIRLHGSV